MHALSRLFRYLPKGNNLRLMVIALIIVAGLFVLLPKNIAYFGVEREGFRQGLDIKGGTHLVYEARPVEGQSVSPEQMDGVAKIIRLRVDAFGVAEPIVQRVGDDRILVQIPGIREVERAKKLIGATAELEFKEQRLREDGTPVLDQVGSVIWDSAMAINNSGQMAPLTGRYLIANSRVVLDPTTNLPQVAFEFNGEGAKMFETITQRLLNQPLGIFLDRQLISAPTVQAVISDRGVITGLTLKEAEDLAIQLNAGAFPIPIELIREQDVDPTLGAQSVDKSLVAGVLGFFMVLVFMVVYYKLPGAMAATALFVYGIIMLATFKLIPVTLTLAGIAGFVLSIGMAVDANVLIFERLKEELRAGRSLRAAVEAGFNRAWTAIRDSNLTTLVTCAILWWFGNKLGTPLVTGFAITLAIGVVTSMFTAIFVTRSFLRFFIGPRLEERLTYFGVRSTEIEGSDVAGSSVKEQGASGFPTGRRLNFIQRRGWYLVLSAAVLLPGIASLIFPPAFKTGIEFSSGSTIEVRFINPADVARLRAGDVRVEDIKEELAKLGQADAIVQGLGRNTFLIRTRALGQGEVDQAGNIGPSESERIQRALESRFGRNSIDRFDVQIVSAIVAGETVRNAALAVLLSVIGIFIYLAWAFRKMPHLFRYSACVIIALVHDVLVVLGLFSLMSKIFGMEMDTAVITGILVVIGYSVNDTIVVFDRIRENVLKRTGEDFATVVNNSLLETIARSVNTSLTTLLTLIALLLLGGATLQPFLLVMLIGIISGTYSSLFIGAQLLVMWENHEFSQLWRRVQLRLAGSRGRG